MTLQEAIDRYIEWQRSHGAKFETSADTLLRFARGLDGEIACDAVTQFAGSRLPRRQRSADPVPREQVLRAGRLLPLRDQPGLRKVLDSAGQ